MTQKSETPLRLNASATRGWFFPLQDRERTGEERERSRAKSEAAQAAGKANLSPLVVAQRGACACRVATLLSPENPMECNGARTSGFIAKPKVRSSVYCWTQSLVRQSGKENIGKWNGHRECLGIPVNFRPLTIKLPNGIPPGAIGIRSCSHPNKGTSYRV